ncbi:BREX-2 system phosphatase PglZ [Rhodococcus spongiicola]|uniref:BREX-2 system phosphatase PglZ n=1 Tax=Rhodococcus spongiicola TaxID=2487352 RepID=A0A3S3E1G3_9NOCA|nr:BREX-2 system phosphatase PglZ [Rhodococcus spongiicola]RVW03694.1 BREX-2 system phosphatase PglZ [Rhodococcus spongiicola]
MSTLTATRPIIAAKLAKATEKRYRHGVLGLRATPTWDGGTFQHDGVPVTVAACPSTLAVWEALESRTDGQWLVILTPVDEKDLGDGVLAHLVDGRLLSPDPWDALRSTFAATTIEPALYRVSNDRALAIGLLATIPTTAITPAPGGVLTRGHAMAAVACGALAMTDDPVTEIDTLAILEWSRRAGVADDLARLRADGGAELVDATDSWLAERAGRLGPAVTALLAAGRITDLVPFGLVAGVLADNAPGAELARGMFLGRYGLTGLGVDDLGAWYRDTAGLVVGSLTARERLNVLEAAAAHVRELGIESLAERSELLPQGLTARLDALAKAVEETLSADPDTVPAAGTVNSVEAAWQEVTRHFLARTDPSCRAAEATVRLLRWLAVDAPAAGPGETTSLAELTDRYVQADGWVDAALAAARRGADHRALADTASRVIDRVAARRRGHDRRFAAALADTPQPTGLVVEQVLPTVVLPLAKAQPTLLLVVDALSVAAATELASAAAESGWSEAAVLKSSRRTGALAVLPTLTQRSRCSLLTGDLREGGDGAERAGFLDALRAAGLEADAGRSDPIFHKKALDTVPAGADLATEVANAIADTEGRPLVAAVLNYVDDTLHHTDPGGTVWAVDTITHLRPLLQAAQRAGRAVIVTSDHGHIIERRDSVKRERSNLYGQRAHGDLDCVEDGEIVVRGPRVLTDSGAVVLAVDETVRYGSVNAGYHGGASPAEAVVPVLALYTGEIPEPLSSLDPVEPQWWHTPVDVDAPPPVPMSSHAPEQAAPTLFDAEESAPETGGVAEQVLATKVFADQIRLAGRIVVREQQIRTLLAALLAAPARELTTARAAAILGLAPSRVGGALLQIKRVLDVEGYEVLLLGGGVVGVDEAALREQFGIGP